MTPEERSREFAPEEWEGVEQWYADEIRVLLLTPVEPENWPVLPEEPSPRFERVLRLVRDGILLGLIVAGCWGLVAGITWGAWKVFS